MYKRVIVKVGTGVLTLPDGKLDTLVLRHLVMQIVAAKAKGVEIVLVTSGAMGAGRTLITLKKKEHIAEKQVLAAVGQVKLMNIYSDLFSKHGQICAQVLATKGDFRDKTHYLNMKTCFENLLSNSIIPIVNENDVVATTELLFTDNDELAGLVASQLNANAVCMLTSVEGFLTGEPKDKSSQVIHEIDIDNVTAYQKYISPNKTAFGRGGMLTKFNTAKKLARQGIAVYFANGKRNNIFTDLLAGSRVGTKFIPRGRSSALKRRIAYSEGFSKGAVEVNTCAEEMLISKTKVMSLLPIGMIKIEGNFDKGDIIEIKGSKKQTLGFGVAQYNSVHARELMGKKNARPIVHYNHMVINV